MPVDHYENFPVASLLLPARLREPVKAIYVFARSADDIADEGTLADGERLAGLDRYRAELDAIEAGRPTQDPVFLRLRPAIAEHRLPLQLFRDLLDAFSQDVVKKRYANFGELMAYCRRSADPIGRLLLHLYGIGDAKSQSLSDGVCSSLQLINHWQDIAIDWQKGRVYLPQDELAAHHVSEAQIAAGDTRGLWHVMMHKQIERARKLLQAGAPLGRKLKGRIGLELRVTIRGGEAILRKLHADPGCVFHNRPVLTPKDWLFMLARSLR